MKKYNIEKQHLKGKYHAIERIILLLDKGSFREIGSGILNYGYDSSDEIIEYDGVITGTGKVCGKPIYVFSQDFSIKGGTLGLRHAKKIAHLIEMAIKSRCPIVGIFDSGGARIDEGINALAGCGDMMYFNTLASGVIPQISVVVGPCAGAAAYSPAITDFVFVVDNIGCMFITGADVVKSVTGEECSLQELGSASVHSISSGVAHFRFEREKECFSSVRQLLDILPLSYTQKLDCSSLTYFDNTVIDIHEFVPNDSRKVYDMIGLINKIVDEGSFIEVHREFATNMVTGFAKLSNITIGIVSNQPCVNSGSIDCDSSDKAARFVRFCDAFNIPIVTLVDTPGYLPGIDQEHQGIIRHGAKLLFAYSEATVPKVTVIIRKAYGGAYIAMGSRHLGSDFVYAWPNAEIAVMGPESAVSVIYKKESASMCENDKDIFIKEKVDEYSRKYLNADIAVKEGYVDELINPSNTRRRIFDDLISLSNKNDYTRPKKKHSNIPL